MTDTPKRIQRQRTAGWRKPEGAVMVCRPGRWGNRWVAEQAPGGWQCRDTLTGLIITARDRADALDLAFSHYRAFMQPRAKMALAELAGRDLGCWCRLCGQHATGKPFGITCGACEPCHADVLGEIANAPMRCEASDD